MSTISPAHQAVLQQLQRFLPLKPADQAAFCACLKPLSVKRKTLLIREGEVCRQAYFIHEGCLRYYYTTPEGEERTGQFFFEGDWYGDFYSFTTGAPADEYIQTLEDCQLLTLDRFALLDLFDRHPVFERWGRLMAEQAFIGLKNRNSVFLNLTPEERYQRLLANRPKVIQRVPQRHIASYLGIHPASLSRIRRRLGNL